VGSASTLFAAPIARAVAPRYRCAHRHFRDGQRPRPDRANRAVGRRSPVHASARIHARACAVAQTAERDDRACRTACCRPPLRQLARPSGSLPPAGTRLAAAVARLPTYTDRAAWDTVPQHLIRPRRKGWPRGT
jgi:hypothetical protein